MISELSSRFINLHPGEVDRTIEDALQRVCAYLGIDMAVLWQWSLVNPDVISPTHIYVEAEENRPTEPMRQAHFPWTREQVINGRIVNLATLDDLPAGVVDRESCRLFGIKSALCVPLAGSGDQPVGTLALTATRVARDWPGKLVQHLQLIANVFNNALVRKRHEVLLRQRTASFAAGAELAGLGFYELDLAGGVALLDARLREIGGIPRDGISGFEAVDFWINHVHPDDLPWVLHKREQLHSGELNRLIVEYRYLHPIDGEKWIHQISGISARDDSGRVAVTFGIMRDVTEQRRVEEERRSLSRHLIRAHEDERALLARELHDDLTQRLAVLAMDVGSAELAAGDTAQAETMRRVRLELVRLSEDVHSLAYQLHPSVLEELGLVDALRGECERRVRLGKLDLSMDFEPVPSAFGKDAGLCLFRVAQEALNNASRHAGTRAISITLRQVDGGLLLAVRDDGVGFDATLALERMHLGIASMRERVHLLHGTLDIDSAPGLGTTVVAWVPAPAGEGEAR